MDIEQIKKTLEKNKANQAERDRRGLDLFKLKVGQTYEIKFLDCLGEQTKRWKNRNYGPVQPGEDIPEHAKIYEVRFIIETNDGDRWLLDAKPALLEELMTYGDFYNKSFLIGYRTKKRYKRTDVIFSVVLNEKAAKTTHKH
jgi:hypothetical protein